MPTLIIHAADDPFMTDAVIPKPDQLSEQVSYELYSHGGHVGFISGGSPLRPQYFLEIEVDFRSFELAHRAMLSGRYATNILALLRGLKPTATINGRYATELAVIDISRSDNQLAVVPRIRFEYVSSRSDRLQGLD